MNSLTFKSDLDHCVQPLTVMSIKTLCPDPRQQLNCHKGLMQRHRSAISCHGRRYKGLTHSSQGHGDTQTPPPRQSGNSMEGLVASWSQGRGQTKSYSQTSMEGLQPMTVISPGHPPWEHYDEHKAVHKCTWYQATLGQRSTNISAIKSSPFVLDTEERGRAVS